VTDLAEDTAADGMPAEFAGEIGIEWPAADIADVRAIAGWKVGVYDTDGPVTTVLSGSVVAHLSAEGIIWAEVTLYADADGTPVLHLPEKMPPAEFADRFVVDGEARTATFPFLVTGMTMAGKS
jgi:hypothetical protein